MTQDEIVVSQEGSSFGPAGFERKGVLVVGALENPMDPLNPYLCTWGFDNLDCNTRFGEVHDDWVPRPFEESKSSVSQQPCQHEAAVVPPAAKRQEDPRAPMMETLQSSRTLST